MLAIELAARHLLAWLCIALILDGYWYVAIVAVAASFTFPTRKPGC